MESISRHKVEYTSVTSVNDLETGEAHGLITVGVTYGDEVTLEYGSEVMLEFLAKVIEDREAGKRTYEHYGEFDRISYKVSEVDNKIISDKDVYYDEKYCQEAVNDFIFTLDSHIAQSH